MQGREYRRRIANSIEAAPSRLALVVSISLFVLTVLSILLRGSIDMLIAVSLPLGVLTVLVSAAASPKWQTQCVDRFQRHSATILAIARTFIGGALVVFAVLASTIDREEYQHLADVSRVERVIIAPAIVWFLVISVAAWAFAGCIVYGATAWVPLRRLAAAVSFTASLILPLLAPLMAFHIFQLADALTMPLQ